MNTLKASRRLAVVIPAYKSKYLEDTLNSFANQTNSDFDIYIADDNSPENLKSICDKFNNNLNIHYIKFDNNLGSKNLVQQWNRSVRLSKEPWVWLFADDDIASDKCVENFYKTIENTLSMYNVYAFNTLLVDETGCTISEGQTLPEKESVISFIINRISGIRHSCISNRIFSRNVFESNNGFVHFDLAWYSDDASWIQFAGKTEFYTIPNSKVSFRTNSSINISSPLKKYREQKIKAFFNYLEWLTNKLDELEIDLKYKIKFTKLIKLWVIGNLAFIGSVPIRLIPFVLRKSNTYYKISLLDILKINLRTNFINIIKNNMLFKNKKY